ncbi:ccr4-not transcription complex subunit 1-like protein, partial [Chrysochromulina tobinii]
MSDAPMASSPLAGFGSIVFAQLRYLVQNINKKNQKASSTEISHLLWLYGESSFVHLIVCLLEEIDFRDPKLQKDLLKAQLLTQEFAKLAARPNFVSLFCEIIAKAALPTPLQEDFLHAVAKAVKATNAQQLALGLGLAQCSDQAIRTEGSKFLRTRLNELTMPPNGGKEAVAALPDDLGHSLVFYLERQEGFAKQRVALLKLLQLLHPKDKTPLTLLPLMHTVDESSVELNSRTTFEQVVAMRSAAPTGPPPLLPCRGDELAMLMEDLGYSCCASVKTLSELLGEFEPPDAACVGAVVGMMAKTVTALDDSLSLHGAFSTAVSGRYQDFDAKFDADKEDAVKALTSWNIPAFVKALRERCPALDWASVFEHLDTPALEVPSAAGLGLIVEVHRQALGTALPARCLLGRWTNTHAQLQLLTHLVGSKGHADVDLSKARRVEAAPEAAVKPEHQAWLCVDLTGALLRLSASGHYREAQALFADALAHVPQLLLGALVQMAPAGSALETPLQYELLEQLMPRFLGGEPAPATNTLLRAIGRTVIQLEPWVTQTVQRDGPNFVPATLAYLRDKMLGAGAGSSRINAARQDVNILSVDAAAGIFRGLTGSALAPALMEE